MVLKVNIMSNHKRHTCQKCKMKRVVYKMYTSGKSLLNGKPLWYCIDNLICKFHQLPGADDTWS
jgi:hypothetical protein